MQAPAAATQSTSAAAKSSSPAGRTVAAPVREKVFNPSEKNAMLKEVFNHLKTDNLKAVETIFEQFPGDSLGYVINTDPNAVL